MISLPGYELGEQLYESTRTVVYRARRTDDDLPVVVKMPRASEPDLADAARISAEYDIGKDNVHEGLVQVLALERRGHRPALVMEDFGGVSLGQNLTGERLDPRRFLSLAIPLVEGVESLHARGVVHKDLNPRNVIFNPQTGRVKISDLSIATVLGRETQQLTSIAELEGTLLYLAPEQTGRLNQPVDHRSDYYALGVTFYELLCGRVPFRAADPLEVIHAHLARKPKAPHDVVPGLPPALSSVVMRLLAKAPEERYQSAGGLLHDLRRIEAELIADPQAAPDFEPGERDVSSHLQLPERTYGRSEQGRALVEAFTRAAEGVRRMTLLQGPAGIGKTALARELQRHLLDQGGLFVSGTFSELGREIPHLGLIEAVSGLIRQVLSESDERVARWRQRLIEALGGEGQVLVEVVPEIELLIGSQPAASELPDAEAEYRFNRLGRAFFRVFAEPSHPLVVFLDDLQWADSASLRFLEALMADDELHHLLLVGAFRGDLIEPASLLAAALDGVEAGPAELERIELGPLGDEALCELLRDTLRAEGEEAEELAAVLQRKTLGNPLFIRQALVALNDAGLLRFDVEAGRWGWDLEGIGHFALSDDVAELLLGKMGRLPEETRRVLELAACIGVDFDVGTLAHIAGADVPEVVFALRPAVDGGLIQPKCQGFGRIMSLSAQDPRVTLDQGRAIACRFSHSRVQRAAIESLPEQQRAAVHLRLGRLLRLTLDAPRLAERLFVVANHFNLGQSLLEGRDERVEAAQLNLQAGLKAKAAVAYDAALRYFEAGISLLPDDDAWERHYQPLFELHLRLSETLAMVRRDPEHAAEVAEVGLAHARTLVDRLQSMAFLVVHLTRQRRGPEALERALAMLAEAGVEIATDHITTAIAAAPDEVQALLDGREVASLVDLPEMVDEEKASAMMVLRSVQFPMYLGRRELLQLAAKAAIKLSLEHGNAPMSVMAYGSWAWAMAHGFGDFGRGYEFAQLAKAVADGLGVHRGGAYQQAAMSCDWLREPLGQVRERLQWAHRLSVETGDTLSAAIAAVGIPSMGFSLGVPLDRLARESEPLIAFIEGTLGDVGVREIHLTLRLADTLRGRRSLEQALFDSDEERDAAVAVMRARNREGGLWYYNLAARLALIFERPARALEAAREGMAFADRRTGHLAAYDIVFCLGVAATGAIEAEADAGTREGLLATAREAELLLEEWAVTQGCDNLSHKHQLVVAEVARCSGDGLAAGRAYERAIASAARLGFVPDQALGNELAARHYQAQGLERVAEVFLKDARYCYERWGATAKVAELEHRFPPLRPLSGEISLGSGPIDISRTSVGGSHATPGHFLDLSSVVKASQAISREMVLTSLLHELLRIVGENVGAQRGFIVLRGDGELNVAASSDQSEGATTLSGFEPVAETDALSAGIVNFVARTGEPVVLSDATRSTRFRTDPYVSRCQPRSVMCAPINNQGKLVGAIYLENNLTPGAFTPDRLEVVDLLASQAAISIENARLYKETAEYSRTLEQRVIERTRDLEQKNAELNASLAREREMQNQLLMSEKMASLGNLVAGVAHEINTPIGAVISATHTSQRALEKLVGAIDAAESLEQVKDAPRVKRLLGLLDENTQLMFTAGQRVGDIVRTLRSFARLDEAERKAADLHEGLDSTLKLLHHRIKHGFDVKKDYAAEMPLVHCYPNQVNQVFMNLLVNASDAIELARRIDNPRRISIRTSYDPGARLVRVEISDSGDGVSPDLAAKIFDPGFTTKGVGVGTGLGLSICFNIINKHEGRIDVGASEDGGARFTVMLPVGEPEDE